MKLTALYGQAPELSTSFQTRELTRRLAPWFTVVHRELPSRRIPLFFHAARFARNFLWPLLARPKTDCVLYGNDGFADLRHWRARRIVYWYDAPADWSATPPGNAVDRLRCGNITHATDVFAVSAAQVAVAKRLRPGREESVHYLPVGVDCGFFDFAKADREGTRARLGIGREEIVVGYLGYLGRFQNRFAGQALLEAAAVMRDQRARFLVIGRGPARGDWEREARAAGMGGRFIFTGFVPLADLPSALAAADICVDTLEPGFHSEARSETKLKQYMAMGRACVGTDIGENRVDLAHGKAGILAPPKAGRLAEAIDALIMDAEARGRLGAAARERAVAVYDWGELAGKMARALGVDENWRATQK